jgi:hypothetical protein
VYESARVPELFEKRNLKEFGTFCSSNELANALLFPGRRRTAKGGVGMREYEQLFEPMHVEMTPAIEVRESVESNYAGTEPDPDTEQRAIQWTPELALMLAVLEDAIACYRRTLKRPRQNPEILARQAEFWFRLDDWESPFSFNNISDALGLEPVATREKILKSAPVEKAA